MRRRNRDLELAEGLFGLAALGVFLVMMSGGTKALQGLYEAVVGIILVVVGLGALAGMGYGLFRLISRSLEKPEVPRATRVLDMNTLEPVETVPVQSALDTASPSPPTRTISPSQVRQISGAAAQRTVGVTVPDLRSRLDSIDWFQFEKLVALMYERLGYRVERRGGANADGGIDLIVERDGRRTAVQCKQWRAWRVGVKAVREFLGALTASGIADGIFVTMRGYTEEAKEFAGKHGITILDEALVLRLLVASKAAEDRRAAEILSDTRKFCPKCENEMVLRTATKGPGIGEAFWGCSAYPRCHYTMRVV